MLELAVMALLGLGSTAADDVINQMPAYSEEIFVVGTKPIIEPVARGETVFLIFSVGELAIEASDTAELRAELVANCRKLTPERCARARKTLQIEPRRTENGLEIRMVGVRKRLLRRMSIEGRVSLPSDSPLVARIGVGDVDIQAGIEDLSVSMGIGDLTVHVPESAVGSVSVRTGIGDASIRANRKVESKRRKLVGARASLSAGEGTADVTVGLKIGDAKVILD